jgi:polyisoprenyl-phosphate glycosyltransferase
VSSQVPTVDVSIVLPVYNESGHIGAEMERICRTMEASRFSYEIVMIDDGSTDDTPKKLPALVGDHVRLITLAQNKGSGNARRVGTRASLGEVVVWTDADMSYPNDRIPELVEDLAGYDQVVGARTSEQGTLKAARVPAKWFIRKLACYLTQTNIPDLNSGFRAFNRKASLPFLHLLPNGFSCVTTLTLSFLSNGLNVKYVPIRYMLQVVRMVMSYNPLRVFMPIGLTLLAIALGKGTYDLVAHHWRITANTIVATFTAFQLLAIGLLADLVVRVTAPRPTDAG